MNATVATTGGRARRVLCGSLGRDDTALFVPFDNDVQCSVLHVYGYRENISPSSVHHSLGVRCRRSVVVSCLCVQLCKSVVVQCNMLLASEAGERLVLFFQFRLGFHTFIRQNRDKTNTLLNNIIFSTLITF
jgi:hypothetical protein